MQLCISAIATYCLLRNILATGGYTCCNYYFDPCIWSYNDALAMEESRKWKAGSIQVGTLVEKKKNTSATYSTFYHQFSFVG